MRNATSGSAVVLVYARSHDIHTKGNSMRLTLSLLAGIVMTAGLGSSAFAADFVIKPGNIQYVGFESDAPIETISGISTQASGKLSVDMKNPSASRGTISVPVSSIRTGNKVRDEHLQSDKWLDAANHPDIRFEIVTLKFDKRSPRAGGFKLEGEVTGKLTIKGTTRTVKAPVRIGYIESNDKLRRAYIKGNAIRIRTKFDVVLADFGIKAPDHLGPKLADTVQVSVKLTGEDK